MFEDKNTMQELKNRSPLMARVPKDMIYYSNLQNKAELNQGFPQPGVHKFLNKPEELRTVSDWTEDFSYTINDFGFRGSYPSTTEKNIMAFFGDSCTFGEGLPENKVFPYVLNSYYQKPLLNLGMPGVGTHRIAMIFAAAVRVWNIDIAIITLPNYARFNYVSSSNLMYSILPPHPTAPEEVEVIRKDLAKNFSDQYFMSAAKDALTWIITTAKEKNIKLILGSWDAQMQPIIKNSTGYDSASFELFPLNEKPARDKVHPGVVANESYAKKLKEFVDNEKYVNTI